MVEEQHAIDVDADSDNSSSIEFEDESVIGKLCKLFECLHEGLVRSQVTTDDIENLVKRVWRQIQLMKFLRTDFDDFSCIQNKMMKKALRSLCEKNLERLTQDVYGSIKRLLKTRWALPGLSDLEKARLLLVA